MQCAVWNGEAIHFDDDDLCWGFKFILNDDLCWGVGWICLPVHCTEGSNFGSLCNRFHTASLSHLCFLPFVKSKDINSEDD